MQSKYSIKELEHLSGIKAHTIRAWESRYKLIEPHRTATNIRYYVDEHLKKILNTSALIKAGVKISKIAQMTEEEINEAVMNSGRYESNFTTYINSLKVATLMYEENTFDAVVSKCIVSYGAEKTLMEVVGPFIKEIGLLWQIGVMKVSHEHFASNMLKMKLFALIDQSFPHSLDSNSSAYILYLPADELHELSLLYLYYHLIINGNRVIYLGQAVPFEYLKQVSEKTGIRNFISVFTTNPHIDEISKYMGIIGENFHNTGSRFLLTGKQVQDLVADVETPMVSIFKGVEELREAVLN
ncbi:MerR family transcriptional regulator [Owenweeksia hongkongensis]|uniref:MerR family transcriptional regulator n=1 Tax=Owenweeksia hongkongensis TaxID=253245 RepID=UPI003A8CB603